MLFKELLPSCLIAVLCDSAEPLSAALWGHRCPWVESVRRVHSFPCWLLSRWPDALTLKVLASAPMSCACCSGQDPLVPVSDFQASLSSPTPKMQSLLGVWLRTPLLSSRPRGSHHPLSTPGLLRASPAHPALLNPLFTPALAAPSQTAAALFICTTTPCYASSEC